MSNNDIKKKVFSERQINVSAVLAGPIPPGILIFKNHMALGQEKKAYTSLVFTFILTVLLFSLVIKLPDNVFEKVPSFLIPSVLALLASLYFRIFLRHEIKEAIESGFSRASNWVVAGLSLFGLTVTALILVLLSTTVSFYEGELVEINGNELYYQEKASIDDANKLANIFKAQGFFGPDYGNTAVIKKIGEDYFITIVVDESFWTDEESMNFFKGLKSLLALEFTNEIHLKLESFNIKGESKVKLID